MLGSQGAPAAATGRAARKTHLHWFKVSRCRLAWFVVLGTVLAFPPATPAARPLQTAVGAGSDFGTGDEGLFFSRVKAAGASAVRISLGWNGTAPRRPKDPTNPNDPAYDWHAIDWQVRLAVEKGLEPFLSVEAAPKWAQDERPLPFTPPDNLRGAVRPDPVAYGQFARAVAARYSGSVPGFPRVRLWRAWNEPNLSTFLLPQFSGRQALSPTLYRNMLNAFAAGVHAVHPDNVVVAGSPSPLGTRTSIVQAVAPLRFMRELLCMSAGRRPHPTCSQRSTFDVWGMQPYTSGGPTHQAQKPDDVSLGDVPDVHRLLNAAVRAGRVVSRRPVGLWVTEFSWDTRPPDLDPLIVPIRLQARWVAEALYRTWKEGVTFFTWLALRDNPYPFDPVQSGLYFRGGDSLTRDAPKPALAAFRFPFVAYRQRGGGASIWGRTPVEKRAQVTVEASSGGGWRQVARVTTDRYGIFSGRVSAASLRPRRLVASAALRRTAATYRQLVLGDSPTDYWTLDDAGGKVARNSAANRSGTYNGGPRRVLGALPGTLSSAVALDGKNDTVSLGRLTSPKTVELWLRTDSTTEAAAFSNRNTISRYAFLGVVDGVRTRSFDTAGLSGRAWVTDGRWHHVVYTYDGLNGRIYIDGRLDASDAWTRFEGGAQAFLGYDATLKTHLRGSVDEVALYPYALTEAQIRRHFLASGRSASYPDQFEITGKGTYLRARLTAGGASSLPFSLTRTPDRYVKPV